MRNHFQKNVIEEWVVNDEDCSSRHAKILMRNGEFESCKYTVEHSVYSQEDWMFLYGVSDLIRRLTAPKESGNDLSRKSAEKRAPHTGNSVQR